MMRRALIALLVLGVVTLAPGQSALAKGHYRAYAGKTSQSDKRLLLFTQRTETGLVLVLAVFQIQLDCPGGQSIRYYVVVHDHNGTPLSGQAIDLDRVELYEALHLHGRIGVHGASGTLRFSIPVFDQTETPSMCTTGDLTWMGHRTDRGKGHVPAPAAGAIRVRIGIDAHGRSRTRIRS